MPGRGREDFITKLSVPVNEQATSWRRGHVNKVATFLELFG